MTRPRVRLRAGGNPQNAKADGDASVPAYIAAMPGWKRDTGIRLDALVGQQVPFVQQAVKWNPPFYGLEGQGWFLGLHVFTRYVKETFSATLYTSVTESPIPTLASAYNCITRLVATQVPEQAGNPD